MKNIRLYILLALLLMSGGVTMQAQVRFDWQWGYGIPLSKLQMVIWQEETLTTMEASPLNANTLANETVGLSN